MGFSESIAMAALFAGLGFLVGYVTAVARRGSEPSAIPARRSTRYREMPAPVARAKERLESRSNSGGSSSDDYGELLEEYLVERKA